MENKHKSTPPNLRSVAVFAKSRRAVLKLYVNQRFPSIKPTGDRNPWAEYTHFAKLRGPSIARLVVNSHS